MYEFWVLMAFDHIICRAAETSINANFLETKNRRNRMQSLLCLRFGGSSIQKSFRLEFRMNEQASDHMCRRTVALFTMQREYEQEHARYREKNAIMIYYMNL